MPVGTTTTGESMSASPSEIARDIVIAMIQKEGSLTATGTHTLAAKQVAEVFDVIHKKVVEAYGAE
jgi:hypothetical protein